jgi:Ca2+:H+ antiporter
MPPPHHASIPAWGWVVPLLASALVALKLFHIVPSDDPYVLVLAGLFLGATVFAAVHHAEVLALKLGEPFGSILLAVAVTVIEAGGTGHESQQRQYVSASLHMPALVCMCSVCAYRLIETQRSHHANLQVVRRY